jgi:hemerythrin
MSLIVWRDEFSVGVESVDHEHRELIELINKLDDAMQNDVQHDTVVSSLGEIYAQVASHFALEEKIMRDTHYSDFVAHKENHELLLDELLDTIDSVDDSGSYDRMALAEGLDQWFSDHFRTHDAKLHRKLG